MRSSWSKIRSALVAVDVYLVVAALFLWLIGQAR